MIQSSYDTFRRNILSNWFYDVITLKMDALSKRLDQASSGEDTDVIYMHSCDLNTRFDSTVSSLQFLRLNVVLRPIHFCQFFCGEALVSLSLYVIS